MVTTSLTPLPLSHVEIPRMPLPSSAAFIMSSALTTFLLHPITKMRKKREWLSALLTKAIVCDSKRKKRKNRQPQRCSDKERSCEQLMEVEPEPEHAYSVAAEVVTHHSAASVQEIAAVRIQTAFRGYLARRALQALRGLARLKSLIKTGHANRQAATTLKWMQTVARVQYEVRAVRVKSSSLQDHYTLQAPKALTTNTSNINCGWDNTTQSKEQIEASRVNKQEAAVRRERAMAYAHSHNKIAPTTNSADPCNDNPRWGWNWLERWMAGRTWELDNKPMTPTNDGAMIVPTNKIIGIGNSPKQVMKRTRLQPSLPTPKSKSAAKIRPLGTLDDDTRSASSMQSRRSRRRGGGSVAGSSARDDESCASSSSRTGVPSYMESTESTRAKSRTPTSSAKQRLSFSGSPARGSGDRGSFFP